MYDRNRRLRGLYVITDNKLVQQSALSLPEQIAQAIAGGASVIQYRNKQAHAKVREREAGELALLCKSAGVIFLINDDIDTALAVDADGVHLGQQDTPLATARTRLGANKIIGITCHNRLELAVQAQHQGADYVAFGRFFTSQTKPSAPAAELQLLQDAKQQLQLPVCAIGGITPANATQVIAQGADMLAVIHAVLAAQDIKAAAHEISRLFK